MRERARERERWEDDDDLTMMMEEIHCACSLLESAASCYNNAHIASSSSSTGQGRCSSQTLPEEVVRALNDVFGRRFSKRIGVSGGEDDGDGDGDGDGCGVSSSRLWEEVAERRISMGSVVKVLADTMETGGWIGIMAANVYVGFFFISNCPRYTIFSALLFDCLLRCIRSACKNLGRLREGDEDKRAVERAGKKRQKKGKRTRETKEPEDLGGDGGGDHQEANSAASVEDIAMLLENVQDAFTAIPLKEHQASLMLAIELFVDLPHLLSELADIEFHHTDNGSRAAAQIRVRDHPPSSQSGRSLIFGTLQLLVEPSHGDPLTTAIAILKHLTPSLLLTRMEGSPQQRAQIRSTALNFVIGGLLQGGGNSTRVAVTALCRYMSIKAPERTEPRGQAVDAVLAVVKALASREQQQFARFVVKLSHGNTRQRLFSVDLALALLTTLPDPLGIASPPQHFAAGEAEAQENELPDIGLMSDAAKGSGNASDGRGQVREDSAHMAWWGIACLEALLHRCSDKAPAIRGRALTNLAHALELLSGNVSHRFFLQGALGLTSATATAPSHRPNSVGNGCMTPLEDMSTMGGATPSPDAETPCFSATPLTPGAHYGDLSSLLCKRCLDEKVVVRKAALLLITKSTILMGRPPEEAILQAMGAACSDAMVSIRKAALLALSEVTRRFSSERQVITEWLQSVLPLVLDHELSIQEEVLLQFEELVLDRIATICTLNLSSLHLGSISDLTQRQLSQDLESLIPTGVLVLLRGMDDGGSVASCVKRICTCLGRKKRLKASVALALQRLITASESFKGKKRSSPQYAAPQGAWFLLAEISGFAPKAIGWEFLRHHWHLLDKQKNLRAADEHQTPLSHSRARDQFCAAWAADRVHLLQTISNVAVQLPREAAAKLADELMEHLETFNMHHAEVGAHVKALTVLCRLKATSSIQGGKLVTTWVKELLDKAEKIIEVYIEMNKSEAKDFDHRYRTPRLTGRKRLESGRSNLCVSSKTRKRRSKQSEAKNDLFDPCTKIVTAIFTVGALVLIAPLLKTANLVTLLQTLVAPKDESSEGKDSHNLEIRPAVYAQTWITLGKLCLADDKLAKRLIPRFVQELETAKSAAIRNNIMVAMTDLCIRYTSLIDGYIHKLTKSLRDPCELVRRQSFVLLARLLQRDYVKWRGMLFHRFLLALVDESPKICQMANFLFGSLLRTKAPLLAYNSFVEVIFNLNDCRAHSGVNFAWQHSENDRELFSLRGSSEIVATKRVHIYTALLKQMGPEHLLATTAKLCAEVIAGAADGLLDLHDASGQCVLEDTLKVLALKEMRIWGNRGTGGADAMELDEESGGSAAATIAAAKSRFVTQLAKKNLVQNAIPIFIELKRLLESKNSPLLGKLMDCLRVMLKDYKNEVEEMLVADKQLRKEIMYDMQKHESAKAQKLKA